MDFGALVGEGFASGLGSGGAGLITDMLGNRAARKERQQAQAWEAARYQTAAKDMEAAGLNRILALGSPASSVGQANTGFSNLGEGIVSGATAAQNISESKTRSTLNAANEQAAIASAKAAEEKAHLDREMAHRVRQMLPYEMTEAGSRIRESGTRVGKMDVETSLLGLEEDKQRVLKSLYTHLGPMAESLIKDAAKFLTNAKEGSDGIGMVDRVLGTGKAKADAEKFGTFLEFMLEPSKWNWIQDHGLDEEMLKKGVIRRRK